MRTSVKEQNIWSVLDLIQWSTGYLTDKGFDDARLNVELLLCHVLNCQRIDLYLRYDMILKSAELSSYKTLFQRRLTHEPLQYILGKTEFMGLTLIVNPEVLIPRPETEVLVERVVEMSRKSPAEFIRFLDIGVGCGCIAISLAKYIDQSLVEAIDISKDALDVAAKNVNHYHLENRISLIQADVLKDLPTFQYSPFDVIVSNPPYVSKNEFETLQPEVKDYEPAIASTDYTNGLTFYRVIADKCKKLLRKGGWLFVEMGYDQRAEVVQIFEQADYTNVEVFRDYSGIERVVKAQMK